MQLFTELSLSFIFIFRNQVLKSVQKVWRLFTLVVAFIWEICVYSFFLAVSFIFLHFVEL